MKSPFSTARRSRIIALAMIMSSGCVVPTETTPVPNVPASYNGRPVNVQGEITVARPNITVYVWDSGTVDGDIISLAVNGNWITQNRTLTASKVAIPVTLNSKGYSYLLLYAVNEGSIPPNTAAVSIDDGTGEQLLTLSANLSTNAALNLRVR